MIHIKFQALFPPKIKKEITKFVVCCNCDWHFNSLPTRLFFMLFCRLLILFQNQLFRTILSRISSECLTVWIRIRPDILSGLIWVQTVCKDYQHTTLVDKKLKVKVWVTRFFILKMLDKRSKP